MRATVVLQSADPDKLAADLYRNVIAAGTTGSFSIPGVVPAESLLFAWRGDPDLIVDPDLFAYARDNARRLTR